MSRIIFPEKELPQGFLDLQKQMEAIGAFLALIKEGDGKYFFAIARRVADLTIYAEIEGLKLNEEEARSKLRSGRVSDSQFIYEIKPGQWPLDTDAVAVLLYCLDEYVETATVVPQEVPHQLVSFEDAFLRLQQL